MNGLRSSGGRFDHGNPVVGGVGESGELPMKGLFPSPNASEYPSEYHRIVTSQVITNDCITVERTCGALAIPAREDPVTSDAQCKTGNDVLPPREV